MINLNNSIDAQFIDTNLQLNHISKCLTVSEIEYYFRGLVTTPDNQKQATSFDTLGHYHLPCSYIQTLNRCVATL